MRTRELLLAQNLAHVIATLDLIADRFTADQQERIALQLFEVEAGLERPHRVLH
jgi:hypothetical protein